MPLPEQRAKGDVTWVNALAGRDQEESGRCRLSRKEERKTVRVRVVDVVLNYFHCHDYICASNELGALL
jgi:hypothetical protein